MITTQKLGSLRSLLGATALGTLLAAFSCGGGGGGAPGSTGGGEKKDPDVNKGSYDVEGFDYEDPYPAEFQPLQTKDYLASHREEVAVFASDARRTVNAAAFDDGGAGHKRLGLFDKSVLEPGFRAVASAAGRLDGRRGDELAVLGMFGADLRLAILTIDAAKQWRRIATLPIPSTSVGIAQARVETANVDGDVHDEIIVTGTYSRASGGWVRVYDDPSGALRLLYNLDVAGSRLLTAAGFDPDGDGVSEIAVFSQVPGRPSLTIVEGAAKKFATRKTVRLEKNAQRLVAGNFDSDGGDEIATVSYYYHAPERAYRTHVKLFDVDAESALKELDSAVVTKLGRGVLDATAVDMNRDKIDEVAVAVRVYGRSSYHGELYHWAPEIDRGPWRDRISRHLAGYNTGQVKLSTCDTNADGREELVTLARETRVVRSRVWTQRVDTNGEFSLIARSLATDTASSSAIAVATGDFHGENLILRYTGKKYLDLPDPMPIVVMAAPPTKSAIDQNRDNSSTSYGTERSVERSHGVTTGWCASFSTGAEAEDIFGAFGFSVKQTLAWSMDKTLTKSKKVTWTKTFGGSHRHDVIIFQGTLYHCYEYEIVSAQNEKLVGEKITLNDPVATKTYKWTVDFYNENAPEKARIRSDVITHTVGHPESYRRENTSRALLDTKDGWIDEGIEVGAVPGGTNSTSITLTESNSEEKTRSFSVDWEAEVKIGGATIGGSFGLQRDEVYGITVETGTTYAGEVGDIGDGDEWSDWRYRFGLLVYRYGVDKKGEVERGKQPFQVVTYWVDDLGPAYTR